MTKYIFLIVNHSITGAHSDGLVRLLTILTITWPESRPSFIHSFIHAFTRQIRICSLPIMYQALFWAFGWTVNTERRSLPLGR